MVPSSTPTQPRQSTSFFSFNIQQPVTNPRHKPPINIPYPESSTSQLPDNDDQSNSVELPTHQNVQQNEFSSYSPSTNSSALSRTLPDNPVNTPQQNPTNISYSRNDSSLISNQPSFEPVIPPLFASQINFSPPNVLGKEQTLYSSKLDNHRVLNNPLLSYQSSDPDQRITSPHKPSKPIIKQKRTRSSRSGPSAEIQSSSINIQQDSGHTDEDSYTVDRNHRTRTEKSTKSPSSWTKKKSKKKEFEADSDHSSFASSSDLFPPPSAKPGQKDKQKESRAQTPASSTNHNRRSVKDDDEKPMKDNPTIALAQPTPQASPIRLVPSHPTFVALTSRGRQAICQFSSSIPLKLLQQTTAPTTVDVTVPKTDLPVSIVTIPPGHTFTPTNPTTSHFFLACGSLTYRAESRYSIENKSGTWMEDVLLEPMTNFVIPDQSGLIVTLENKSQELVVLNITSVHPKS